MLAGQHHCHHIDAAASDPRQLNRNKTPPPIQKSAKVEEACKREEETLPNPAWLVKAGEVGEGEEERRTGISFLQHLATRQL